MDLKIIKSDPSKMDNQYYGPPPLNKRAIPLSPKLQQKNKEHKEKLKQQKNQLEKTFKIDSTVENQRQHLERAFGKAVHTDNQDKRILNEDKNTNSQILDKKSSKTEISQEEIITTSRAKTVDNSYYPETKFEPIEAKHYDLPQQKTEVKSIPETLNQNLSADKKEEVKKEEARQDNSDSEKKIKEEEVRSEQKIEQVVKNTDEVPKKEITSQGVVTKNEVPIAANNEESNEDNSQNKIGGKIEGLAQEQQEGPKTKSTKLPNNFIKPNKVETNLQAGKKDEEEISRTTTTTTTTTSNPNPEGTENGEKTYQLPEKPVEKSAQGTSVQNPLSPGALASVPNFLDNQNENNVSSTEENKTKDRINENDFDGRNGQRMNISELAINDSDEDYNQSSDIDNNRKTKNKKLVQEEDEDEQTPIVLDDYDRSREGSNFGIATGSYIDGKFVGGGINNPSSGNGYNSQNSNSNFSPYNSSNNQESPSPYNPVNSNNSQSFANSPTGISQTPRYAQTLQGSPAVANSYLPNSENSSVTPAVPRANKKVKKKNHVADMIGKLVMLFLITLSIFFLLISGIIVGVVGYAIHSTLAPICSNAFIINSAKLGAAAGNQPANLLVQSCRVFSQITGIGCEFGTGPTTVTGGGGSGGAGGTGNQAGCIAAALKGTTNTVTMTTIKERAVEVKRAIVLEIMKYGREAGVDEFTVRFAIAVHPMESIDAAWSAENQFGCLGLAQFCKGSYEAAIVGQGVNSKADFKASPVKQMRTIQNFLRIKRDEILGAPKCVRDFFVGKSDVFKLSYAWFTGSGACPGSVDGNNVSNYLYSPAAETNFNRTDCNEWRELLQTFPTTQQNNGQTAYFDTIEKVESFINSFTYLNPFMIKVEAQANTNIMDLKVDKVQAPLTPEESALLDVIAVKESGRYADKGLGNGGNMGKYQMKVTDIPEAQKAIEKAGYVHTINSDFNPISQDYLAIGKILKNAQLAGNNKKLSEILASPDGFTRALGFASIEFQALPAIPGYPRSGAGVNNGLTIEVARKYFEQQLKIYRENNTIDGEESGENFTPVPGAAPTQVFPPVPGAKPNPTIPAFPDPTPVGPGETVTPPEGGSIGAGTGNYCTGAGINDSGIAGGNFDGSNASSDLSEFDKWYKEKKVIVPNDEGNRKAIFDDVYAGNVSPAVIKTMVALASSGKFTKIGIWSLYRPGSCSAGSRHSCGKGIDIEWLEVNGKKFKHLEAYNNNKEAQAAFLEAAKILKSTKEVDQIISCGPMADILRDNDGFKAASGQGTPDNIRVVKCTAGTNDTTTHRDHYHVDHLMSKPFTPKGR